MDIIYVQPFEELKSEERITKRKNPLRFDYIVLKNVLS